MDSESCIVMIDAVPQKLSVSINENICKQNKNVLLNSVLDDFSLAEFKSIFFLLMDYVGKDNFLNLTKQNKCHLKQKFCEIYKRFNDDCILIELLGTMKMYKKLRMLDTCCHLYNNLQERKFNQIDGVWKMLYSLCEELIDDDLEILKEVVPSNFKDQIVAAEDFFCWALQKNIFSKADLSKLERIFNNYPNCLNIIQNFEVKLKSYDVRTPTADSHCGIALIINIDSFDEESKLPKREGSDIDVNSLETLWDMFGFETKVLVNLTASETLKQLEYHALLNHSNYDAFVCCILSHGKSNCVILSDGTEVPIPVLIASVTNNCCASLASKPKLFFIQACQGTNIQQGVGKPVYQLGSADASVTGAFNLAVPPIASDVLKVISSIDGYVSFRSVKDGSWFIHGLCKSMERYGDKFSILDVMTQVNNSVREFSADFGPGGPREALQFVNCSSTLGKTLILKKRIS